MSENNVKQLYKSENLVVQKCLDILDETGIKCQKHGGLTEVFLNQKSCFSVGPGTALFVDNLGLSISHSDNVVLLKKLEYVLAKQKLSGNYRKALEYLEQFQYQ